MDFHFSFFMIPPFLCFTIGITLAVISVLKGKRSRDNIHFSLVCIWVASLLPIAFLSHFFIRDVDTVMRIERSVHILYVFLGYVTISFYHRILGMKRRRLEIGLLILGAVFSIFTQTRFYLTGLYTYPWGHIAIGGIVLKIFGLYSISVMVYGVILCVRKLRTETNSITRSKIKYILVSINVMLILTCCNLPAMNGINFYPLGNFMFIPLIVMAYGVLRYRLLDIRSIVHLTFIWLILSSLFLIPNAAVFIYLEPFLRIWPTAVIICVISVWFFANAEYLRWIQPRIDRLFNRQKMNLLAAEASFVESISMLKSLEGLLSQFKSTITKTLHLSSSDILLREKDSAVFSGVSGCMIEMPESVERWFCSANHLVDVNMVQSNPDYEEVRAPLMAIFETIAFPYIVPLVQNGQILGLLLLGEKANLKTLTPDEIHFINNIRSSATISLANAVMYQNLSDFKDNLENIVQKRTHELKTKNEQMIFELKVAKKVQKTILPNEFADTERICIAAKMIPLMEVSGDFYEVMQVDERTIAVAVIDVSGHGVPAALLTSMIKYELQAQIKKHSRTNRICSAVNRNLCPLLIETGFYFTMFLCIIDTETMMMEFTNCGQVAPILFRKGKFIKFNFDGFFIGLSPDSEFECRRVQLRTGDRVYLYTDGVTEARDTAGDDYGEVRFMKAIMKTSHLSINNQLEAVMTHIDSYRDQSPAAKKDDITLLGFDLCGGI